MRFRAIVRNEGTGSCPWFVYVTSKHGQTTYACRFATKASAGKVAAAMNRAWEDEDRLYTPDDE